ncbi:GNAT family N-acetyltransferase [Sporolactobacillus vineae]|uniref:GNAT family N-acetyltransferase n=1 Tax=Sporolactobacillus vineae TaxID=444463 RepID=UPI000288B722|nr:GNAT family N-acetyltransferase [Sporolactobacillus vineae]
MSLIDYRVAAGSDAALIRSLMRRAFAEYQNSAAPSSAMQETEASIQTAMSEGEQALIASEGDGPVGMIRYLLKEDHLYFFRLSVTPEEQGKGIAKKILQELESVALENGKHEIRCRVRQSVGRNLHLYQSVGYCVYGQEIVHKPSGINIDVVKMSKTL